MHRTPSTDRGERTRERLLEHAASVFAARGYHATSVAHVCREAGVANGSFYQYFEDKRAAFEALVATLRERFERALQGARGVEPLVRALLAFLDANARPFQAFREAEFLEVTPPRAAFWDPAVALVRHRLGCDEAGAWGLLGGATFVALGTGLWRGTPVPPAAVDAFVDLALHGVAPAGATLDGGERTADAPALPAPAEPPPPEGRAERTRHELLAAARRCFSRVGYAAASVADVTREAGVAQGTFYVHFTSKRAALTEVIDDIRRRLTDHVAAAHARAPAAGGAAARLERERRNLVAFLSFLEQHGDIYRVVREAEFAEPAVGRGYYEAIAGEYALGLREALARGEVRDVSPDVAAWSLMGTSHAAGYRFVLQEPGHRAPADAVDGLMRWIERGAGGASS